MTTLIFTNPGEIDIRGATIAGLSAKDTKSPIGYFGTGLKYVIAQVLANGGTITIYSGLTSHTFSISELMFRGEPAQQVAMTTQVAGIMGDECEPFTELLGFTTSYGKDWQPWQIFRELYSNALDEGGGVVQGEAFNYIAPERTVVAVSGWPALLEAFGARDQIILPKDFPVDGVHDDVQVTKQESSHLYYRGVRVKDMTCLFTWNFTDGIKLTEDRTLKSDMWSLYNEANDLIKNCGEAQMVRRFLTAPKDTFEQNAMGWLSVNQYTRTSDAFVEVLEELWRKHPAKFAQFEEFLFSRKPLLEQSLQVALTPVQYKMLHKAKQIVSDMGFADEIARLPIDVLELGGQTLGRYRDGKIALSPLVFAQGTKQVVSTLLEEVVHARTSYQDCCYELQTYLFNQWVSMHEQLTGEPI